jgi:hypothetical protein
VHYELSTIELPSVTFLYLAEDGVCYFLIQAFNHDEAGIGRTFVGTWTMDSNGAVTAKTGNNTETTLVFSPAGNVALNPRTNEMYVNLTALGIY